MLLLSNKKNAKRIGNFISGIVIATLIFGAYYLMVTNGAYTK